MKEGRKEEAMEGKRERRGRKERGEELLYSAVF
jgi:hypothetical protein